MKISDVKDRVADIAALGRADPEVAHIMEDSLYADLLKSISVGACTHPAECALEALKSSEIEFPRWCA